MGQITTSKAREIFKDRFDLYYAGLSDGEIAEALNLKRSVITSWRNRFNLPNINSKSAKEIRIEAEKMQKPVNQPISALRRSLADKDVIRMLRFLWAVNQYGTNTKPQERDVLWFMHQYRIAQVGSHWHPDAYAYGTAFGGIR